MTEIKSIIVSVKLTANDLEDFYTHNSRRGILMKLIIACALLVFASQLIRIVMVPEALEEGWKWVLAVIALFFLFYFINKSNAAREFKRNKKLQESHVYVINEDTIHIKGGPFNTIFQWDKLYNMTESKKSFFIWLSKNSAQIIPKREMSAEDIARLQVIKRSKFK